MRIYAMTATFGKLRHETLTLKPGLNILHAPNEWGKSTWCAFLLAMLYGLDTRAKSTKTQLAQKERYAPWTGEPMSGRIDLHWNGRDITIERTSKGRIPMGEFRAWETHSGLEVPELTAANCGAVLLGVERSVFIRSGFIRFSDLQVTDDDALRRRLNALVTTGDETGTGEKLSKDLKELKNRIRYHRTGLLPQAEAERDALKETLREMDALTDLAERTRRELKQLEDRQRRLENHRDALAFAAAGEDARRVALAAQALEEARKQAEDADAYCRTLPPRERAEQVLHRIGQLQERQSSLQMELRLMPGEEPELPVVPPFEGMDGEEALSAARRDGQRYENLQRNRAWMWILPLILALGGGVLAVWYPMAGWICAGMGVVLLCTALVLGRTRAKKAEALAERYGTGDSRKWAAAAEEYAERLAQHRRFAEMSCQQTRDLEQRLVQLQEQIHRATNGQGLEACRRDWERAVAAWDSRTNAHRDYQKAQAHYQTLQSMAKTAKEPAFPDDLEQTEPETRRLLSECLGQRQRLENRLGQYQGRMEALGDRAGLEARLARLNDRVNKLEQTYAAVTLAQETLAEATAELQRRFAPRIAAGARERISKLTGGRYESLNLAQDLTLRAAARQEDTLREVLWRSDGTVDQLYLALRLAVAEELTPDAPLILDDALVRFDDDRLKSALELLREEAQKKQVLLFTCQRREQDLTDLQ